MVPTNFLRLFFRVRVMNRFIWMAVGLRLLQVQNVGQQNSSLSMVKVNDCGAIAFTDENRPIEALYEMLRTHPLRKEYNSISKLDASYKKLFNLRKGEYRRYLGNFEDYTFSFDIIASIGGKEDKMLNSLFIENRRHYKNYEN